MNQAGVSDIPRIVVYLADFHAQSGLMAPFDAEDAADFVGVLVASDEAAVFVSDRGVIGGAVTPIFFNADWLMAVELFWWSRGDGVRLLRAFERWALDCGVQEIRLSSLSAIPRSAKLIARCGYAPAEACYMKVV